MICKPTLEPHEIESLKVLSEVNCEDVTECDDCPLHTTMGCVHDEICKILKRLELNR